MTVCLAGFFNITAQFLPHLYLFKILSEHSVLFQLVFLSLTASNYFAISSNSCILFSPNFATDMVDEFCLSQLFYHLQIQAWRIVSDGCNTLHSTTLLLGSKIQDSKKILHFHIEFLFWVFFVCLFVCLLYLVPLCTWMDRRILPICWKCMFNLPK